MFSCLNVIFLWVKTHYNASNTMKINMKTETLRSISSLIPASFGCVFGMVGKLSEQAFQRVFFHIFMIKVQIVMNF